ncbi:MAG TPA: hypothetical protein VMW92_01415 [Candidatus Heimdallarchaeota archaeon]|nr:hypothetical protein [Candidatus Heimdallarchaeota archaeon]
MGKGIIIHLDNDDKLLGVSGNYFKQCDLRTDFDFVTCKTREEFIEAVKQNKGMLKSLIFDLVGPIPEKRELDEGNAEFLDDVETSFAKFSIPIFIYTGYLDLITERFKNYGTVFKVDKDQGINVIFDKIKLFHDSGFLDVFCPGGVLEVEIYKEIHESFVKQFRNGEIESIIKTVQGTNPDDCKARCTDLFKRIATKALMSKLLSPVAEDKSTVNAIEHYYRRISAVDFWTGDILEKNDKSEKIIVLTPRCDCSHATNYLVCKIEPDFPPANKKDQIRRALTDNPNYSGTTFRYLPPAPVFNGGRVNFSSHKTITKEELQSEYSSLITLSDDLTNEILAKMCSYFLRTGINTINVDELVTYLDSLNEV